MGPLGRFGLVVAKSVQDFLTMFVPFPCDSPRGAKEVPGEQSCPSPWHQYPEKKIYIKKCTSLQLAISSPPSDPLAKNPLGGANGRGGGNVNNDHGVFLCNLKKMLSALF